MFPLPSLPPHRCPAQTYVPATKFGKLKVNWTNRPPTPPSPSPLLPRSACLLQNRRRKRRCRRKNGNVVEEKEGEGAGEGGRGKGGRKEEEALGHRIAGQGERVFARNNPEIGEDMEEEACCWCCCCCCSLPLSFSHLDLDLRTRGERGLERPRMQTRFVWSPRSMILPFPLEKKTPFLPQ